MSSQDRSNNRSGGNQQRRNNKSNSHRRGVPQRKHKPAPVKLSWWQKFLSKLGLYTPPAQTDKPASKRASSGQKQQDKPRNNKPTAKKAAKKREPRPAPPQQVDSARLYVGNLSYDVTEQDLLELFKGFGGVKSAEVVYNKRTQRSKGFAFVQMGSVDDAKRAVDTLHEQPFMGRNMIVNGARTVSEERKAIDSPAA